MTAAPREGQAEFLKSSLKSPGYDGSKSEDFYQWMLLEVIYNDTEDEAYPVAPPLRYPNHPRTGEQHFYGDAFSTGYGHYQYMTAIYGPSAEGVKRTVRIQSQISRGQLKRQTGSAAVCYVAVPMPTTKERFIWINLTYPIRAFYIPSASTAHPQYKEHAIFSRLVVRGRKGLPTAYSVKGLVSRDIAACQKVLARINETGPEGPALKEPGPTPGYLKSNGKPPSQMYAKVSYENEATGNDTWGWGLRPQRTVLITYSRRTDEYRDPYVCFALFDRRVVQQSKILADIDMAQAIDLVQAQSKEEDVRLQYEKDEPDNKYINDLIVGFIAVGLGFIPVVGPLELQQQPEKVEDDDEPQRQSDKTDDGNESLEQQPETSEASNDEPQQHEPEDNKDNDETPQPQSQNSSDSESGRDAAANNENTEPQPDSDEASSIPGDETSDAHST